MAIRKAAAFGEPPDATELEDTTMNIPIFASARCAAAALVLTMAFASAPQTAGALTIDHNGLSVPGGVIADGAEDVNVLLADIAAERTDSELVETCDDFNADACLVKGWFGGSQNDVHLMQITPDGSEFTIVEYVGNLTGVAWTDYHLEFEGAELAGFEAALLLIDTDGNIVDIDETSFTTMEMGNSLWFFFDDPFVSAEFPPVDDEFLVFGIAMAFENAEETVLIGQHPSLGVAEPGALALMGIGLVALGAIRRRRRKGNHTAA